MRRVLVFVACLVLALSAVGAAHAEGRWLRAESASFIVYSDISEPRLQRAVGQLEVYDALLRRVTNTQSVHSPAKLEIYLFRQDNMIGRVAPSLRNRVDGFYTALEEGPIAVSSFASDSWARQTQHVLFHEYAHHFMFQYFPTAYPSWYIEGFAEYFATTLVLDDRLEVGRVNPAQAYSLRSTWLPMEQLLTVHPSTLSVMDGTKFYAQSWALVHYMHQETARVNALRAYHAQLRTGADPLAAFAAAFGKQPSEMQVELQQYATGSLAYRILRDRPVVAQIAITRLPEDADELLPLRVQLLVSATPAEEADAVAQVRHAAARYPAGAFAQTTLARAEIEAGDRVRARSVLAPVLAASPDLQEAQYLMGLSYIEDGSAEGADRAATIAAYNAAAPYLRRAAELDPGDVAAVYRYAQALSADRAMTDQSLDQLLRARALAPQVASIGIQAAVQLMSRRRFAEAVAILDPIVARPHGGDMSAVRVWLEAARRGEMPSVSAAASGDATK